MNKKIHILLTVLLFSTIIFAGNKPSAEKIEVGELHNLYKVDNDVYRAEQPTNQDFLELEKMGIKTVLCLRNYHDDEDEIKGTNLVLKIVRMKASKISYQEILKALQAIKDAEKPVLVHCWHGSDRTGCIIAAYRMVFNNWTKEEAIFELRYKPYRYNWREFPNIVDTLEELNIKKMRKDLGLKK